MVYIETQSRKGGKKMQTIVIFLVVCLIIVSIVAVVGWYEATNNLNEWSKCQKEYKSFLIETLKREAKK